MQQATRSRLLMLGAAVLWSTSGIMVKSPAITDLPLAERGILLAFYRAVFATITLLPWLRPRAMRWRVALIPMVCSFAAMNLLYLTAMTRSSIHLLTIHVHRLDLPDRSSVPQRNHRSWYADRPCRSHRRN